MTQNVVFVSDSIPISCPLLNLGRLCAGFGLILADFESSAVESRYLHPTPSLSGLPIVLSVIRNKSSQWRRIV